MKTKHIRSTTWIHATRWQRPWPFLHHWAQCGYLTNVCGMHEWVDGWVSSCSLWHPLLYLHFHFQGYYLITSVTHPGLLRRLTNHVLLGVEQQNSLLLGSQRYTHSTEMSLLSRPWLTGGWAMKVGLCRATAEKTGWEITQPISGFLGTEGPSICTQMGPCDWKRVWQE